MRLFELRSLVATTAFLCRDSTPPRDATSVTGSNAPTCRAGPTCLLGTAPGRAVRRATSRRHGAVAGLYGRCRCGGAGCRAINAGRRHARWRAPCRPGEASISRGSCSRGHPPAAAPSGLCGRRLRGGPAEWTRDWRASPSSARWVHIPPAGGTAPPGLATCWIDSSIPAARIGPGADITRPGLIVRADAAAGPPARPEALGT